MNTDKFKVTRLNHGSGGIYEILGDSKELVDQKAKELKEGIDYYRSPVITPARRVDTGWLAEVKYYGLD
jgi:hypothetical protein